MSDCERAVTFVVEHGDEVERARLRYLLTSEPPSRDTVASLFAGQRTDGGWAPFWAPSYSSVDATCFRLAQAEQLGLLESEPACRGHHFLRQRQSGNGSWEEDASVQTQAPPWARRGDPMARIYLTANAGYWLARADDHAYAASRAAASLREHADSTGRLSSFPHARWLAAGCLHATKHEAVAESIMNHMGHTMIDTLPASNPACLLVTLLPVGVPAQAPPPLSPAL